MPQPFLSRAKRGTSPFRPHFGQSPQAFVGRNDLMQDLADGLATGPSDARYTCLLTGSRGSGKTVVLNEVEDMAAAEGWVVLTTDASTPGLLERTADVIAGAQDSYDALGAGDGQIVRSTEKKLGIGLGPLSGSVSWKHLHQRGKRHGLREHLAFLVEAADKAGTSVLFTVDELHAVDRNEARRLANDLQFITRRAEMPLAFLGAGLSEIRTTLMRDRKMTFFHRCEEREMSPISLEDCVEGLAAPIHGAGGDITAEALESAVRMAHGSPYRLQLVGDQIWRVAGAPETPINIGHVETASVAVETIFDKKIGVPAWHDLSERERDVLGAVTSSEIVATPKDVGNRLGIGNRVAHDVLQDLLTLGYLRRESRGEYASSGLVSSRVVNERWEHSLNQPLAQVRVGLEPLHSKPRCRRWMPRAQAYCVLPSGHAGSCRSKP